jgi:cytochrome oxidase assembly protein ShyY1
MKPEDVMVMVMSNPPNERVTRLMQARNETAEIEALALMEPPRGSFNRRNKETDPLWSRKKGCASEKRD